VPEGFRALARQRVRWDRGMLRTYYHKHGSLMNVFRYDWRNFVVLSIEALFSVLLPFAFVVWLVFMFWNYPAATVYILLIAYVAYAVTVFVPFSISLYLSERRAEEAGLLLYVPLFPLYKEVFRWVRFFALCAEFLRVEYEDSYLPESSWQNTQKW
jgi:cellulose synthase/poly-beta-1,6-N-acetylglucosamine synthase-like glycosyltransferase